MKSFLRNFKFTHRESFILTIIIHALIFLGVGHFSQSSTPKQWSPGFNQRNAISINIGHAGAKAESPVSTGRPLKKMAPSPGSNSLSIDQDASASGKEFGAGETSEEIGNDFGFDGAIINYQEPAYPRLAIKRNLQGKMKIKITLTGQGKPKNIEVLESTGHPILDKSALDTVSSWTFKAHPKNEDYYVNKTIIFELK